MGSPQVPNSIPVVPTNQSGNFVPPQINSVEDTGLGLLWLQDLALKILYFQGYLTGFKIAEALALPFLVRSIKSLRV
jgi:hypothetical protein